VTRKAATEERQYLDEYRPQDYPRPSVAVDLVIFTIIDARLVVLLVRRKEHPFKGAWVLPGGFVRVGGSAQDQGEDLDAAARRELLEETGLDPERVHVEQLAAFGRAGRDPRMRVISVAYVALVRPDLAPIVKAGGDASDVRWVSMEELKRLELGFDHREILEAGLERTRTGLESICQDLGHLMDATGLGEAVVVGHSMGVQVALEFHRRYRARVKGLVLICGSYGTPLDTWHDHSLLRLAFPSIKRAVERAPELSRALVSRLLNTPMALEVGIRAELNPELIKRSDFAPYIEHLAKMDPLAFVRTLDSLKDHSALDHLAHVDVPTIVIGGEGDRFTPVWLSQRMAELIPHAEYIFIPGGTHTAPLERPNLVNAAVERFLSERVRPASLTPGQP